MGIYTQVTTYADGNTLTAAQLNGEFQAIAASTNTVDSAQIATAAVTTAKIADLNVTTGKLADLAVTTAKIVDNAVTSAKVSFYSSIVLTSQKRRVVFTLGSDGGANLANFGVLIPKKSDGSAQTGTLVELAVMCSNSSARTYTLYKRAPTITAGGLITTDPFATSGATVMFSSTPGAAFGIRTNTFSVSTMTSGDTLFMANTGDPTTVTITVDFDY